MDGYQVKKYQELIRDDMVVYKNSLECILALVNNKNLTDYFKIHSIRDLCETTLSHK